MRFNHNILCRSIIYDKVTRISSLSYKYIDHGKILNLFTSDCHTIYANVDDMYLAMRHPAVIGISIIFAIYEFGILGLVYPISLVLIGLLIYSLSWLASNFMDWKFVIVDNRSKLMNETLSNIKNVKFDASESIVTKKVENLRERECSYIRVFMYTTILRGFMTVAFPSFVTATMDILYNSFYDDFNFAKALSILAYSSLLMEPASMMGTLMNSYVRCKVSFRRVDKFLNMPESSGRVEKIKVLEEEEKQGNGKKQLIIGEIRIEDLSCGWEDARI